MQFMNEVMNMHIEHEDVAYNGFKPIARRVGTNTIPPPNPNPLKIPAIMLLFTIYPTFYSAAFEYSLISSPFYMSGASQPLNILMFL